MTIDQLNTLIQTALAEDLGSGDVTTQAILPPNQQMSGQFIAKANGVVAGLSIAEQTFKAISSDVIFNSYCQDGDLVKNGTILATVTGPGWAILSGERAALNFMQRMSGIATMTRQFVDAVAGTTAVILDTRKTAPGLRITDKTAVKLGGGQNHRIGLYDMALIKENHIAAVNGDLAAAVNRVKQFAPDVPIEIEVTDLAQLQTALTLPVNRIMLDNMTLNEMRQAVALTAGKIPLEASGNVNMKTVRAIAETGVDYISIGALTHSVKALDISLLLN